MFTIETIKDGEQFRPRAIEDTMVLALSGTVAVDTVTLPCELSTCSYTVVPAGQCLGVSVIEGAAVVVTGDFSEYSVEQGSIGVIDEVSATVLFSTFIENRRDEKHCECAVNFILHQLSLDNRVVVQGDTQTDFVSSVISYMVNHMDEPLTLAVICAEFDCSKLQLNNRFKESGNKPPMKVLADMRIERAVELLEKSDLTISQIANATGYGNLSAFSHFFKKMTGQSPNQIRSNVNWLM